MLCDFLFEHREKILALTKEKTAAISEARPKSEVLERGLPIFYDHLISVLREEGVPRCEIHAKTSVPATSEHGKELLRLGYTVSQVVHGYGVICQAITETADNLRIGFGAREFSVLNLCLDKAIAEAVTEFEKVRDTQSDFEEIKRLGFFTHELRNALSSASLAFHLIKEGAVGTHGNMSGVLERNLRRMRDLIDGALSEVRMNSEPLLDRRSLSLIDVVQEVEATAVLVGRSRGVRLSVQVDPKLQVHADRQCLISAVANLVQNAMKFTKPDTVVSLLSREDDKHVILDVEDCCGGLSDGHASELFIPFVQKGADHTGCGLGLAISRRAIARNGGDISVSNIAGKGCVFSIALPKPSEQPAHPPRSASDALPAESDSGRRRKA
ncbi:MAG: HAMP domain-containing sensor histidine kinase [Elusimicrobiota bacterium]|jgi:signal transduction histidine kinase